MCVFTVNISSSLALPGQLIFISPSIPIGTLHRIFTLVPLPAFSGPFPPILPDIHDVAHHLHLLGHGVCTFSVEGPAYPESSFPSAKAFIDAERNGLARFQLPYIGPVAERWLSEE